MKKYFLLLFLPLFLFGGFTYQRNQLKWSTTIAPETANTVATWNGSGNPVSAKVALSTHVSGSLPAANGGTGLTALGSPLHVLRVNAGGTALEFAASSSGINTGSTDNALLRADGTGGATLQSSAVVVDDDGNTTFGLSATATTTRTLTTNGSSSDINLALRAKNGGTISIRSAASTDGISIEGALGTSFLKTQGQNVNIGGSTTSVNLPHIAINAMHQVVGTPAVGIGTSYGFITETADDNFEIGATVSAISTDVSAGSEDFDLVFNNMVAGATAVERFRITSGGGIVVNNTVTSGGTTGNRTINNPSGTVNFAAAATTLVVTNNLVSATSIVFCTVRTNDATAIIKNVVPAAGSFTITLNAAATAETSVGFLVLN